MSLRTICKWPLAILLVSSFAFAGTAMAQEEAGMIPGKKKKTAGGRGSAARGKPRMRRR